MTNKTNRNDALEKAKIALSECEELFKAIIHTEMNERIDHITIAQIGARIADEASRAVDEAQTIERRHQNEQEVTE